MIINAEKYEIDAQEAIDRLRPMLTDEFFEVLVEAAKTCGWSVDHVVTDDFVNWCRDVVGKERSTIVPYEYGILI